jgi:hypothetical protein
MEGIEGCMAIWSEAQVLAVWASIEISKFSAKTAAAVNAAVIRAFDDMGEPRYIRVKLIKRLQLKFFKA